MSVFGNRVPRVEDPKLLTDGGTYVADLRIPELDLPAVWPFGQLRSPDTSE